MGAREVMRRVRDGYRLERPSHCHPDLYKIIAKCWAGDMNKRPDFSELRLVSKAIWPQGKVAGGFDFCNMSSAHEILKTVNTSRGG